ncbi:sushi, von Willebrand factor type A, EGF and pentraxin domain-containing protein 1-like [Petromyzon marinus]|uniref:sushi, von Willebrand factor type A, EGF and pentraxin domain-containing protein 1-like n=1 Tax=Petromyzon marinus TaxID=7757 RepID=UPI003F720CA4
MWSVLPLMLALTLTTAELTGWDSLLRQAKLRRQAAEPATAASPGDARSGDERADRLAERFAANVRRLRDSGRSLELVFLLDESSGVSAADFAGELRRVQKLLSDVPAAASAARVAVVTFSSRTDATPLVDRVSPPRCQRHECPRAHAEGPGVGLSGGGGGTRTEGALLQAAEILRHSGEDSKAAVFLVSDGHWGGGGDPRGAAAALRASGAEVFTVGVTSGNVRGLGEMASAPASEHCYLLDDFEEFEALAYRALHNAFADVECPLPGPISNGAVEATDFRNGSSISFRCHEGYTLIGGPTVTCLSHGEWSQKLPSCEPISCGAPDEITNGVITENGITYLSTATYVCTTGYRLRGPHVRTCQASGQWSGESPECEVISCGEPPRLSHAIVKGESFTFGNDATYVCSDGYNLVGTAKMACLGSGMWTLSNARCTPLSCGAPPRIEKAVVKGDSYLFASTLLYVCADGYKLEGHKEIVCNVHGKWAPTVGEDFPQCVSQYCGRPPAVLFSTMDSPDADNFTVGFTVSYKCQDGYQLNGDGKVTCQSGGRWLSPIHSIRCVPVDCGEPATIDRGYVSGNNYSFGAVIAYSCERGYYIKGEKKRTCQSTGEWSGKLPSCQPVSCGEIPQIDNGRAEAPNGTVFESVVRYLCDKGYRLHGSSTRSCQANRQWSAESPPSCVEMQCKSPPVLENGVVSSSKIADAKVKRHATHRGRAAKDDAAAAAAAKGHVMSPGFRLEFKCKEGYQLSGDSVWTCGADGLWNTGVVPACSPVRCPAPPPQRNLISTGNSFSFNSLLFMSCVEGYKLVGSAILQCTASRTWSNAFPKCIPINCTAPPELPFGSVSGLDYSLGKSINFSCLQGFHLKGKSSLDCLPSGRWSSDVPECVSVECPHPETIANGIVDNQGLTYLSRAFYTCKPGYRLSGAPTMQCGEEGRWIGTVPTCEPVTCLPPKAIPNGRLTATGTSVGDRVTFACERGYRLEGESSVGCVHTGRWSAPFPSCVHITCGPPQPLENGFVEGNEYTFGSLIIYSCFPGFQLLGNGLQTCEEAGWGDRAPACVQMDCGPPPHIDFGEYVKIHADEKQIHGGDVGDAVAPRDEEHAGALISLYFDLPPANEKGGKPTPTAPPAEHKTGKNHGYQSDGMASFERRDPRSPLNRGDKREIRMLLDFLKSIAAKKRQRRSHLGPMSEYLYGTLIRYHCLTGFDMEGPSVLICQEDGTWNGTAPKCHAIQCEAPRPPENGAVEFHSRGFESVASYRCDVGYTMVGRPSRSCTTSRTWDAAPPVCVPVTCGAPEVIAHGGAVPGDVATHGGAVRYGGTIRYACAPGYSLVGRQELACQANGTWSAEKPKCLPQECRPPAAPSNGRIVGRDHTFQSEVRYVCNAGYTLIGKTVRTCLFDGRWSNKPPVCKPVSCEAPRPIANGRIEGSEYTFGKAVHYRCLDGFSLRGVSSRLCESSGSWSNSSPSCEGVTCGPPPDVAQGYLVGSNFDYGDAVEYVCFSGYELRGDRRRRCLSNGSWSADSPRCEPLLCGPPPEPENGEAEASDRTYGSVVAFRCRGGFEMTGPGRAVCEADGSWSSEAPTTCRRRSCGSPPELARAALRGGGGGGQRRTGESVAYECRPGFALVGDATLACNDAGRWGELRARCVPLTCGPPPSSPRAEIVAASDEYDGKAYYRCAKGFRLAEDVDWRTCLSNGSWSANPITCAPRSCGPPPRPPHALVRGEAFTVNSSVRVGCREGYRLAAGDGVSTCRDDGVWSPPLSGISCEPASCGRPNVPAHGSVDGPGLTFGSVVTFSCRQGYALEGPSQLSCLSNGSWSAASPACVAASCPPPSAPPHGFVAVVSYSLGGVVRYECDAGYVLHGARNRSCLPSREWSGSPPACVEQSCEPPRPITNGRLVRAGRGDAGAPAADARSSFAAGSAVEFACDEGYRLEGSKRSSCTGTGEWSVAQPACVRVYCGTPVPVMNAIMRGMYYQYGDMITYSCYSGYMLDGPSRSFCLQNSTWSLQPSCKAVCRFPCQNGGLCLRPNSCFCAEGWMGLLCEEPICILPCLNGGRCKAPYQCECPDGWQGSRCHLAVCRKPCLHGGKCVGPNRCQCLPTWSGQDCSRRKKAGYYKF